MTQKTLSILLLTEDSAADAEETLRLIVSKALHLVDADRVPDAIRWLPINDTQRRITRANTWKPPKKRVSTQKRRDLVTIRAQVVEALLAPTTFVFWHVDADVAWSQRGTSGSIRSFEREILHPVEGALREHVARQNLDLDVVATVSKLIPLNPYWCIEAWCFQSFDLLERLCARAGCKSQGEALARPARHDRAQLDEVPFPKRAVCIKGNENLALAKAFPARDVLEAGASFAAAIASMNACVPLCRALERSWRQFIPDDA